MEFGEFLLKKDIHLTRRTSGIFAVHVSEKNTLFSAALVPNWTWYVDSVNWLEI